VGLYIVNSFFGLVALVKRPKWYCSTDPACSATGVQPVDGKGEGLLDARSRRSLVWFWFGLFFFFAGERCARPEHQYCTPQVTSWGPRKQNLESEGSGLVPFRGRELFERTGETLLSSPAADLTPAHQILCAPGGAFWSCTMARQTPPCVMYDGRVHRRHRSLRAQGPTRQSSREPHHGAPGATLKGPALPTGWLLASGSERKHPGSSVR